MPCTKCFMRTRVVSKITRFKQTALKWSWWTMHVIGSLFASVKADASAICFQHRHSRRWFNVAAVQCKHLQQSRVTKRPKTSSSLWASGRFESQKQTLHIRIMKLNNFINSKPQGLLKVRYQVSFDTKQNCFSAKVPFKHKRQCTWNEWERNPLPWDVSQLYQNMGNVHARQNY